MTGRPTIGSESVRPIRDWIVLENKSLIQDQARGGCRLTGQCYGTELLNEGFVG